MWRGTSESLLCSSDTWPAPQTGWSSGLKASQTANFPVGKLSSPGRFATECFFSSFVGRYFLPPAARNQSEQEQEQQRCCFQWFPQTLLCLSTHSLSGYASAVQEVSGQVKRSVLSEACGAFPFIQTCHCAITLKWLVPAKMSVIPADWRRREISCSA